MKNSWMQGSKIKARVSRQSKIAKRQDDDGDESDTYVEARDRRHLDRLKVIEHHSKRTAFAYDRLGNEFD